MEYKIPLEEATRRYGCSKNIFYQRAYRSYVDEGGMVNVDRIERDFDLLKEYHNKACEYYYYLTDECGFSVSEIAREWKNFRSTIASKQQFLYSDMWNLYDPRSAKLPSFSQYRRVIKFIKWCEEVIPKIEFWKKHIMEKRRKENDRS